MKRIKITMLVRIPERDLDQIKPARLAECVKWSTQNDISKYLGTQLIVDAMTARWTTLDAGKTKGAKT